MMQRLKEIPIFSSAPTEVEADLYNLVRRAVLKSSEPIRIPLSGAPHLEMIIDEDSWTCVDAFNDDLPIVAWLKFEVKNRTDLHSPIRCVKNYYHFAGAKVSSDALNSTVVYLEAHMNPAPVCMLDQPNQRKKTWKTNTETVLSCVK